MGAFVTLRQLVSDILSHLHVFYMKLLKKPDGTTVAITVDMNRTEQILPPKSKHSEQYLKVIVSGDITMNEPSLPSDERTTVAPPKRRKNQDLRRYKH